MLLRPTLIYHGTKSCVVSAPAFRGPLSTTRLHHDLDYSGPNHTNGVLGSVRGSNHPKISQQLFSILWLHLANLLALLFFSAPQ